MRIEIEVFSTVWQFGWDVVGTWLLFILSQIVALFLFNVLEKVNDEVVGINTVPRQR